MSYPITVNGAACLALQITHPVQGIGAWRVQLPKSETLSAEQGGVTISYDGLTVLGTLLATYNLSAGVTASGVFGYRGWATVLKPRGYHSASGIRLSTVLTDLERETGERFASKPDTVIGTHWNRPAGVASLALNALAPRWRVLPSGLTTVATVAAPRVTTRFEVTELDEGRGVYTIGADLITQFLPGAVFSSVTVTAAQTCGTVEHSLGEAARAVVHSVKP